VRKVFYAFIIVVLLSSCAIVRPKVLKKEELGSDEALRIETLEKPSLMVELPENLQTKLVRNYKLNERSSQYSHPVFYPITGPYQKIRNDSQGDGFFGASRGYRSHNGLDIVVTPSSGVYSPIEGVLLRKAYPYGTSRSNEQWEGCVIVGVGDYQGYEVKIFYMRPFVIGEYVFPGDIIGVAQDISRKYSSAMIDHLHVEVRRDGILLDPATLFELVE
jgi:murein DD-endopeptidase MepM/ murein hydrolase activator NlpD